MKREQFVQAVQRNAARVTHYQSGADGQSGGCDCIGLIIGAVRMLGETWQGTHGSNYAARYRMGSLAPVTDKAQLQLGQLVYKCRERGDSRYALPDRYKNHPDSRDYYHVGVVMSVSPLEILHCSTGGIHRDTALGAWRYAGELDTVTEDVVSYPMTVHSVNGGSVNLRQSPAQSAPRLALIPCGTTVSVLSHADENWDLVEALGKVGYMMRSFLKAPDTVQLTLPRDAAQALLMALKSSLGA